MCLFYYLYPMKWMLQFIVLLLLLPFSFSCSKKAEKTNATKNSYGKTLYKKAKVFCKNYKNDSAYYYLNAAKKQFILEKDSTQVARVYRRIALIKARESDYMGSDLSCVAGLSFLANTSELDLKASFYNRLGLNAKTQGLYDEALAYFEQYISNKSDKKIEKAKIIYYNNIGLVYQASQKYPEAIESFNQAIALTKKRKDSLLTAKLLDNKAWSLYLNDSVQTAKELLLQAYKTRTKYKDKPGMIMSHLHLARVYHEHNNNVKALQYAKKAFNLCVELKNSRDQLQALALLSKIDPVNSTRYFSQHKQLQDSLIKRERHFKNQTAKIHYETAQKETQITTQKQLLEKRKKSLLLGTLFAFILVVSVTLLWFQKRKIKGQYTTINTLQRELHHRVKTNFTIMDAFVEELREKTESKNFTRQLTDLQNRIHSMYEIHSLLYKGVANTTHFQIKKYIDKLSLNVQLSFQNNQISIQNKTDDGLKLPVDRTFPVGLIINEFLTNSYKYAFKPNQKGSISIHVTEQAETYTLNLSDNGKGLPENFNIKNLDSFGMDVIQLLTKQLKGTFLLKSKKGVSLSIQFPKA